MSKTTKSDIWNYFVKTGFGGQCKHCLLHVKFSGNTTNLHNHMKRKHAHLYEVSSKVKLKENERLCDDTDGDQQMRVCWCWLYYILPVWSFIVWLHITFYFISIYLFHYFGIINFIFLN